MAGVDSEMNSAPPTNKGVKFPPEVLTPDEARVLHAPRPQPPTGFRNWAPHRGPFTVPAYGWPKR